MKAGKRKFSARKKEPPPEAPERELTATAAFHSGSPDRRFLLALAAILLLATALRVAGLPSQDMWLDESNAVLIAGDDMSRIPGRLALDASPPLYYLLLHGWMEAFGRSEAAVRSLSVLFGCLLVAVTGWVGRSLFSTAAGLLAALVAAVSPIQVMYSQQARMYALLPLLALLSMFLLLRWIREQGKGDLGLWVLFTALALYTHNTALYLLPAQGAVVLLLAREKRYLLLLAGLGFGAILVLYAPWIPSLLQQIRDIPMHGWREVVWQRHWGLPGSLLGSLAAFSPGGPVSPYVPLNSLRWIPIVPVLTAGFLLIAGSIAWSNVKEKAFLKHVLWALAFLIVPLVACGLSSYRAAHYLPGRTDQLVFPAWCLLASLGIGKLGIRRWAGRIALLLFLFLAAGTLVDYYGTNWKEGDRRIAEAVRENSGPGDAVICTSLTRASLEYYLRDEQTVRKIYSFPPGNEGHLGHEDLPSQLANRGRLEQEARDLLNKVIRQLPEGGRCVLLYVHNPASTYIQRPFTRYFPQEQTRLIGNFKQSLLQNHVAVIIGQR